MSSGGTIDRILDSIPGYGGYRDKERRRDSDRVIRENLALEYGQLADRLGRLATSLADERKITLIATVDKPYKRLTSFIDRVRTASYGYSPLFSNATVDANALDQVALFDRALADQKNRLAEQIAVLESISTNDPSFKTRAAEITTTVDGLHDRFDKRHDVIHTGKALPPKDVTAYLEPARSTITSPAYRLHENEAVSYKGTNYSVTGRVTMESDHEAWRAFQLKGGDNDDWLIVSADTAQPSYWMQRATPAGSVGDPNLTVNEATYNLERIVNGKGEVIGASGTASNQPVRFGCYRPEAGTDLLFVFDWGSGTIALHGSEVDSAELEVFTRET